MVIYVMFDQAELPKVFFCGTLEGGLMASLRGR